MSIENINYVDSKNYSKVLKENKVKNEIQKEPSEFDILKRSTKEFDIFKQKIINLQMPNKIKEKILDKASRIFYELKNDNSKLSNIKKLNQMVDIISNSK